MHIGTTARSPRGTIEASVLIGRLPVPLYRRADGALFVAGLPGSAYTLRIRNLTPGRIEVISAVDQRNTLKDEPADASAGTGLVFGAHQSGDFTGWRISDDETREFLFGAPERSVAVMATGTASGVGVIGFAVYCEQAPSYGIAFAAASPPASYGGGMVTRGAVSMNVSAAASADTGRSLGTGIGERQSDHVGRTSFTRASGDPDILAIGYDTLSALDAMGITGSAEPDPFPGLGTGYEKYAER